MRSSAPAKRLVSGSRPKRLTSKRIEASFETEVKPSTVPASLLPTSFVLPPPSPESSLPPHPPSLLVPSLPLLFPSTTPPFPPPVTVPSSTADSCAPKDTVPEDDEGLAEHPALPTSKPFPLAKPLPRNIAHAYSPAKPSPLSRILMLADSPGGSSLSHVSAPGPAPVPLSLPALLPLALAPNPIPVFAAAPIFEPPPQRALAPPAVPVHAPMPAPAAPPPTVVFKPPPPPSNIINAPAPAPLRTGTASNTTRRRASKRTSGDAGLDQDPDAHPYVNINPTADEEDTRDPRAPEKENTIRRKLRGPAAAAKSKKTAPANAASSGTGPMRKVPTAPRLVAPTEPVELGRTGGAASRLLAATSAAAGRGEAATASALRRGS